MTEPGRGQSDPREASPKSGEGTPPSSLEERLRRLEGIVGELETEDPGLDQALALFEEGVRLVKEAEEALAAAELRVEELLGDSGNLRIRTMEEEA